MEESIGAVIIEDRRLEDNLSRKERYHCYSLDERHFEDNEENCYIWSENNVRNILRSPIYAGNLAGYKRIAANMKNKKRPSKLPKNGR